MAVNVTVRDIVNFPGGTAKTITVDIIQVVPVGGSPLEGDEIWVSSTTTTATASGGGSIESIFKNEMIRGFVRSSGLITGNIDLDYVAPRVKVAIDEDIDNGVNITLASGTNLTTEVIREDLEAKIQAQATIGGGGAKEGNLSYLNAQVRFVDNKFQIEAGTVSDAFIGTGKSSVAVGAPDTGTDIRANLGFDIPTSSEDLAAREIVETDLASGYASGDLLEVTSTAGFEAGDGILVTDGTDSQNVLVSGAGVSAGLSASEIRFVTVSGVTTGLAKTYVAGTLVKKLHQVDVKEPVSAVTTVDELYRFAIDSQINQIDFSA